MNYTLADLVSVLRQRLQDQEFDEETLKTFINESQSEILGEDKYPFMQRIDKYLDVQAGEINLPLGYAGTFAVFANHEDEPRRKLEFVSPEEFFDHTDSKTYVFTTFANSLFFRIAAKSDDSDNNRYNITHLYLSNPLPMVEDTDRPFIPGEYIEALILGALARAEQRRDNFDYAQIFLNQQDAILTNMKLRYGPGNLTAQNVARLPFFGGYANDRY